MQRDTVTRPRPARVLIVGYYGAGLAGDEAILRVLVRDLVARYPGVSIVVTSASPAETAGELGIGAVSLEDLAQIVEAIGGSDLVLLGGGGLFTEYSSFRPLTSLHAAPPFNTLCAEIPALAAAHSVPCAICAVGVEMQTSAEARAATRRAFTLATSASVRDTTSLEALAALGPADWQVVRTCDPAATLPPTVFPRAETLDCFGLDPSRPVMSLSLRHWDVQPLRLSEEPQPWEAEVAEALTAFCHAHDFQLLLVPSQRRAGGWIYEDDVEFCKRFREQLAGVPHALWTDDLGPEAVAGAIGLGDLSLAMRHHGVVFAVSSAVPCAAVAYAPKVHGAMRDAGLGRFSLALPTLRADTLLATMTQLWREAPALRADLETLRRRRFDDHAKSLELVDAALTGGTPSTREMALAGAARRWLASALDRRLDEELDASLVSLLHYAFSGGASPLLLRQPMAALRARLPHVAAVAYYYGYLEAIAGEHLAAAEAALTQAIGAGFTPAWAHFNRAQVHLWRGDANAARADLETALALDPTIAPAREQLAALTVEPEQPQEPVVPLETPVPAEPPASSEPTGPFDPPVPFEPPAQS